MMPVYFQIVNQSSGFGPFSCLTNVSRIYKLKHNFRIEMNGLLIVQFMPSKITTDFYRSSK